MFNIRIEAVQKNTPKKITLPESRPVPVCLVVQPDQRRPENRIMNEFIYLIYSIYYLLVGCLGGGICGLESVLKF